MDIMVQLTHVHIFIVKWSFHMHVRTKQVYHK